jgi:hypothetical protein
MLLLPQQLPCESDAQPRYAFEMGSIALTPQIPALRIQTHVSRSLLSFSRRWLTLSGSTTRPVLFRPLSIWNVSSRGQGSQKSKLPFRKNVSQSVVITKRMRINMLLHAQSHFIHQKNCEYYAERGPLQMKSELVQITCKSRKHCKKLSHTCNAAFKYHTDDFRLQNTNRIAQSQA